MTDELIEKIARSMASALGCDPDELHTIGLDEMRRTIPYWMMQREWAIRHIAASAILEPSPSSLSDRQYLEKIADQVIARNQTETAEAPAKKLDGGSCAAKSGAGGVASACPALIDDVRGE